jgi:DNA-binding NtrC family response regulator
MTTPNTKIRILLVRPWTESLAPLRAELRAAGFDAQLVRIDFEPALNAALMRDRFDVIIYDPTTRGITRELIETRLRENRRAVPVVVLDSVSTIARAIERALAEQRN